MCKQTPKFSEDVPKAVPLTIEIIKGGITFKFPDKFTSDLFSMLKCFDTKTKLKLPKKIFPNPGDLISIKEFTATQEKFMKLVVLLKGIFIILF